MTRTFLLLALALLTGCPGDVAPGGETPRDVLEQANWAARQDDAGAYFDCWEPGSRDGLLLAAEAAAGQAAKETPRAEAPQAEKALADEPQAEKALADEPHAEKALADLRRRHGVEAAAPLTAKRLEGVEDKRALFVDLVAFHVTCTGQTILRTRELLKDEVPVKEGRAQAQAACPESERVYLIRTVRFLLVDGRWFLTLTK